MTRLPDSDLTELVEAAARNVYEKTGSSWDEADGATKNLVREQALPFIFHGTKALADLGYAKRKFVSAEDLRVLAWGLDREQIVTHLIDDCDVSFKEEAAA